MEGGEMPGVSATGYEEPHVTRAARLWTGALLAVLVLGILGGVLTRSAAIQTFAMAIAFVLVIVGYVVLTRKSLRGTPATLVAGLTRSAWVNIGLAILMMLGNYLYGVSNQPLKGAHSVAGYWDRGVPTLPPFVVPYLGMYVMAFLTLGFQAYRLMDRHMRTYALALTLAMGTALLTFVLFQTWVPTGGLDAGSYGGLFGGVLRYVNEDWYGKQFFSAFPSMHCGYATVVALAWYRFRRPLWSTLAIINSVLIVAATQVLHEHRLMDAMYGIIVGVCAFAVAWFWCEYLPAARRERLSDTEPPTR
jgi:hypothetical protein